ncbi:MAG: sulfatase-like hydrolase/transferase [Pirellulaceae bacterium]|nr:sulfatase-like hydrolase/transferase [Planctomycetales bacterium]
MLQLFRYHFFRYRYTWSVAAVVATFVSAVTSSLSIALAQTRPNIVHIFADDLGWGSVGYNRQTRIQTPNLDALAYGGMIFNHAYAATVCGPSRAMLYSGFHNGHTLVDSNQNLGGDPWRADGQTVGNYLKDNGYRTALFGKWGFGGSNDSSGDLRPNPTIVGPNSLPTAQGFETFYGYLNHGRAHSYNVDSLWTTAEPGDDNSNGIDEVGEKYQANADHGYWLEKTGNSPSNVNANYTADLITNKTLSYISSMAESEQPFYVEYASTIPHFDIDALRNFPDWFDLYGDDNVPGSDSWTDDQKAYAAMITRFDAAVGQILATLRDPNGDGNQSDSMMANTLIFFTSDNGATAEDNSPISFFEANGIKRGGKRDLWDGGINAPMVAYWEETIAPGQVSERYTDMPDFLPTALEFAGVQPRVGIDGVSLAHELTGKGIERPKNYIVQEHHEGNGPDPDSRNGRWALIKDGMKLIRFSNGDMELYDLDSDPDENNPVNLTNPVYASIRDYLQSIAVAEGVEQGDGYSVQFQDWNGATSNSFSDAANWTGTANVSESPNASWSAVINNSSTTQSIVQLFKNTEVLGLEVRGTSASQTLRVNPTVSMTGRNEIRISSGGRIQLDRAALNTVRWLDVKAGGQLTGDGTITGDVYNWGRVAPGLPADLDQPPPPPDPPEIPEGVNTGSVAAIVFDFTGVQDDAPLVQTSAQSQYLELLEGLNYGPGLSPRDAANDGNEFNIRGHESGTTLASALPDGDYLTYTVAPVHGIEMLIDTIEFTYRRNGTNAAKNFGILTSMDGFQADAQLAASPTHTTNDTSTHVLTAPYQGGQWVRGAVETRFYGWNANSTSGNTHVYAASMSASFRTIAPEQAVVFDFGGTQNNAPLTTTSARDPQLELVTGLDIASGLQFVNGPSNLNHEFDVVGWSTGASIANAIDDDSFITYTVQTTAGVEMQLRQISYELWRESASTPTRFAIMTSARGFDNGDEVTTFDPIPADDGSSADPSDLIGYDARRTFTVDAGPSDWTAEPVEIRLYGWGANSSNGGLHLTGAALTAYFRTRVGSSDSLKPTGILSFDGSFFHVDGALIEMELGGTDNSNALSPQYDQINISGAAEIHGSIRVSLANGYEPAVSDAYDLFDWTSVTGDFSSVMLPELSGGLEWDATSLSHDGMLRVVYDTLGGDFDQNGVVDGIDFLVWQRGDSPNGGNSYDYRVWHHEFAGNGQTIAVPEPALTQLVPAVGSAIWLLFRKRNHSLFWRHRDTNMSCTEQTLL